MANQTINGLTATDSGASTDWLPIWKTALGITRKIAIGDLLGGFLTGGGTVATAGFTATVPRTGTLTTAYNDVWTPVLTGSVGNPTISATTAIGTYKKIDELVICEFTYTVNTTSGGSGNIRVSLPFTAKGTSVNIWTNMVIHAGLGGASGNATAFVLGATNYMSFRKSSDGTNYLISDLGAGDVLTGSFIYLAST